MALELIGGFHVGPLFEIKKRRPTNHEKYKCGWYRRDAEYAKSQPVWFDEAEQKKIDAIYKQCAAMNRRDGTKTWAVDHIVPLNHPLVCGMHIACNLQIIRYEENASKSNNWWPDMPEEQMDLFKDENKL